MKLVSRLFLVFMWLGMLGSCKPSKPRGILSESRMARVLVDYHLAQGMAENAPGEDAENRFAFIQAVFKKHHITQAEFDSSMVYYSIHAEDLIKIYKVVNQRIEANANLMGVQTESKTRYSDLTTQGDTANIWSDQSLVAIFPRQMENIYSFTLKADTTFRRGDSFLWHFNPLYVLQGNNREAFAQLVIRYEKDSVLSASGYVRADDDYELKCQSSGVYDSLNIRSITGHVYMPISTQDPSVYRMLLLSDFALVRYHKFPASEQVTLVDSLDSDTIQVDTLPVAAPIQHERLTPLQMRESQPREKTINVVKEREVNPNLRPSRNINAPVRRRIAK